MSLNIQERDLVTGELKRTIVAGNSNIVDTAIKTDSTWSSKKISTDLADKQDFRIFNSLEEFNEKKGTSLTVVSGIDNMKDIANAMSNGEILIIITKCELGSEVYFGLTKDTGWTKMFTFIKSNGLCDVECRTTFPLTIKRVLNSDGVIGDWQEIATKSDLPKLVNKTYTTDEAGAINLMYQPGTVINVYVNRNDGKEYDIKQWIYNNFIYVRVSNGGVKITGEIPLSIFTIGV